MSVRVLRGDCRTILPTLPANSVHCVVTSPVVWYNYGMNKGWFKPGQHWRAHGKHREREWLEQEYATKGRSTGDIAAELGFTDGAVLFWLRRHGIKRRDVSGARSLKHWGVSGEANPMFGRTGAANPNYIDGSSPERQRAYVQAVGRAFLRAVYERDGYRCVRCSTPKGKPRSLHAHHIKPWAGNEALRFDPTNAVSLCRKCHSWVHSRRNTAREYLA